MCYSDLTDRAPVKGSANAITSGNNVDYSAKADWHARTEWGIPDGTAVPKALEIT